MPVTRSKKAISTSLAGLSSSSGGVGSSQPMNKSPGVVVSKAGANQSRKNLKGTGELKGKADEEDGGGMTSAVKGKNSNEMEDEKEKPVAKSKSKDTDEREQSKPITFKKTLAKQESEGDEGHQDTLSRTTKREKDDVNMKFNAAVDKRDEEKAKATGQASGPPAVRLLNYTSTKGTQNKITDDSAEEDQSDDEVDDEKVEEDDEGDMRAALDRFTKSKPSEADDNILSLDLALDPNNREEKKPRGVVYVGSLPPGLKPNFIKFLLAPHGNITRMFFEKEDETKRKRRVTLGGSSGYRFTEGWVEFATKKEAKKVALMLNGTRIGPRKASRFYDDFWIIKYLSGFTWDMLLEKAAIQRREREQRLRLELARAKKEDEAFLQSVARSKKLKRTSPAEDAKEGEDKKKRSLPPQLAPILEKRARSRSGTSSTADEDED